MEEAEGFRLRAWRVVGWKQSQRVIDEIAESIRHGDVPNPTNAEEVEVVYDDGRARQEQ